MVSRKERRAECRKAGEKWGPEWMMILDQPNPNDRRNFVRIWKKELEHAK